MKQLFPGVWKQGNQLFTENLVPGIKVFTKSLVKARGKEFREWNPYRSKAAAALMNGLGTFPLKKGAQILYLGISSGSTASFFSDIIGTGGIIYGVEISERSMRDVTALAEQRKNIVPILANAKLPASYSWVEPVDVVYQDVATNDQSDIIARNAQQFLKPKGIAMIAIKSRSIDVVKKPEAVFQQEMKKLSRSFTIIEKVRLEPYEKDHLLAVMKLK
jgi:fibrillarin-like pre-rRNA processing protein